MDHARTGLYEGASIFIVSVTASVSVIAVLVGALSFVLAEHRDVVVVIGQSE
jgi:hypothetical protein